jgi:hypothetical protein
VVITVGFEIDFSPVMVHHNKWWYWYNLVIASSHHYKYSITLIKVINDRLHKNTYMTDKNGCHFLIQCTGITIKHLYNDSIAD